MSDSQPLKVFISYSHKDEALKEELEVHLANLKRQGKIQPWQDRAIEAGTEWAEEIRRNLEEAQIILLLITPRFIASEYCYDKEMKRAMERHEEGTARVIPVILKPADWQDTPFSKLQYVPKDGKPVTQWSDQDEAFVDVVKGIRNAVEGLQKRQQSSETQVPISETTATPVSAPPAPPAQPLNLYQKRIKLNQLLSGLPGPQFEQVIFALRPPAGNVPSSAAPQGQRVAALLEWAESPIGLGLDVLESVVNDVINPR